MGPARALCRGTGPESGLAYTSPAMVLGFLNRFVDSNDREVRRIQPQVDEANRLEAEFVAMSDDEIRERIADIREEMHEAAILDEPSEDELHHPDLERRREHLKARRKHEKGSRTRCCRNSSAPGAARS